MEYADIDEILQIELVSHEHPWTRKNFKDCIDSKYWNYVLLEGQEAHPILGYCIVMPGVEELHLLNITIAPNYRRQRIAYRALQAIETTGKEHQHAKILLEVRTSNHRAIALYKQLNYEMIATRKNYYPMKRDGQSLREDAIIMEKVLK
jgi:ribosomal-protein-alanine N-acetyltransferase